jgi:hypothetical protein
LTCYSDIHPDLADTLFHEVERAKKLIAEFPSAWMNLGESLKGFVLRRYPYTIVREDVIWIVAYAHHKRRPGYWHDRLKDMQ